MYIDYVGNIIDWGDGEALEKRAIEGEANGELWKMPRNLFPEEETTYEEKNAIVTRKVLMRALAREEACDKERKSVNEYLRDATDWAFDVNSNPAKAVELLEEGLKIYPNNVHLLTALVRCSMEAHDYEKLFAAMDTLFCIDHRRWFRTTYSVVILVLIDAMVYRIRDIEAEERIRKLIEELQTAYPNSACSFELEATLEDKIGHPDRAYELMKKAGTFPDCSCLPLAHYEALREHYVEAINLVLRAKAKEAADCSAFDYHWTYYDRCILKYIEAALTNLLAKGAVVDARAFEVLRKLFLTHKEHQEQILSGKLGEQAYHLAQIPLVQQFVKLRNYIAMITAGQENMWESVFDE